MKAKDEVSLYYSKIWTTTLNTAVISDIKLCLRCFLPLSGPVEYITLCIYHLLKRMKRMTKSTRAVCKVRRGLTYYVARPACHQAQESLSMFMYISTAVFHLNG